MINSVTDASLSSLLDQDEKIVYVIPPYQREYTWGKTQWDSLYNDVTEHPLGYYLGTIICINQTAGTGGLQRLDLIDGQQRMTSLSLLYAALYKILTERLEDLDDDDNDERKSLRMRLTLKRVKDQPRLEPQVQASNQQDYYSVLRDELNLPIRGEKPTRAGNRRIYKAYRHFLCRLGYGKGLEPLPTNQLIEIIDKVNAAVMVSIEVGSHSDAYTLFESLNNRGVPLTAVDIIKNKLLSLVSASVQNRKADKLEPELGLSIDDYHLRWVRVIEYLGDDYTVQDRFLRHYYNAFRGRYASLKLPQLATRTTLIPIYEGLLDHDFRGTFTELERCAKIYGFLNGPEQASVPEFNFEEEVLGQGNDEALRDALRSLKRIQGVPSYMLLLYVMRERERLDLSTGDLAALVQLLVRFFVRRNLTERPPTYELARLFMRTIETLERTEEPNVYDIVLNDLLGVSADDETFARALRGPVYESSSTVTKFMLASLAEQEYTREFSLNLWALTPKKKAIWTVEHVFPQGDNIPQAWVDMIADGNMELAQRRQDAVVHTIGNLTLSGYNSSLSNMAFADKRERKNKQGLPIGYNNGLSINRDIYREATWTLEKIEARTERLAEALEELFALA